jgi:hypothetical protein
LQNNESANCVQDAKGFFQLKVFIRHILRALMGFMFIAKGVSPPLRKATEKEIEKRFLKGREEEE